MLFNEMPLDEKLKKAIAEMGFSEPTTVQKRAIPLIIDSNNVVCKSHTGSGKTAAFIIPNSQRLLNKTSKRVLIIGPTRELVVQVYDELKVINKYTGLRATVLYGGHGIAGEMSELRRNSPFVVATPGRLDDHIKRRTLDPSSFDTIVLDEADRMLDMGFIEAITDVIKKVNPKNIHLFSATLDGKVAKIIESYLKKYMEVEVEEEILGKNIIKDYLPFEPSSMLFRYEAWTIEEMVDVTRSNKFDTLVSYIKKDPEKKFLVFVSTKRTADDVSDSLSDLGYKAICIHGNHTQPKRERALKDFKAGKANVLVATDVMARGLHIDKLNYVISYDSSFDELSHKHRIGRVGRMGEVGYAITFVEPNGGFRGGNGPRRGRQSGRNRFGKTRFNNDRDNESSDRPRRPRFGNRGSSDGPRRPRFGDRESSDDSRRPRFGDRESSDDSGKPRFGDRKFSSDGPRRPRFGDRESSDDSGRPRFNDRKFSSDGPRKPRFGNRGSGRRDGFERDGDSSSEDRGDFNKDKRRERNTRFNKRPSRFKGRDSKRSGGFRN